MIEFKYRPDVDGLRAVAVILVLLFHARFGFTGGFVGVDVFFVISGFLITGLILKEQQSGAFRLSKFWTRRVRRIIPASCAMVFVTLLAGVLLLFPRDYEELAQSTIAQQVMLSNVYFWKHTGYFAGPADSKPLLHTWSLAVEEQFYLVYPFLLAFLGRTSSRTKAGVLGVVAMVSLVVSEWGVRQHAGATFYLLPTRAWELLIGGLLCFAPIPSRLKHWQTQCLSLAGLAAIVAASWCYDFDTRFPGATALAPCVGTAFVIYANSYRLTWVGRLLAAKPMVFVGLLSYSLYLWHWPILAYLRYWLGDDLPIGVAAIALALSVALAYLSWRFVETPLRRGSPTGRQWPGLVAIGGTVPVLLACSWAVVAGHGFDSRVSTTARHYRDARDSQAFIHEVQIEQVLRGDLPTFGASSAARKCLVWGDSHAMALMPGLDAACNSLDIRGFQATHSTTPPILEFAHRSRLGLREKAPAFNRAVLDFAIARKIDVIVMNGYWSEYLKSPGFEERLSETIDIVRRAGMSVVIVLDVAAHDEDVPMALARPEFFRWAGGTYRGQPNQKHLAKNRRCNEIIERAARGKATIVDPAPYFVDREGLWRAEIDGQVMFRDRAHLTVEGGLRLKPMFEKMIEEMTQHLAPRASSAGQAPWKR